MFVDEVEIEVEAGGGGNGMVTFRKEKFVPRGGPNGGDGGHGGSVIFEVDHNITTLLDFRYRHKYKADRGGDGASKDMFGKNGGDLLIKVPPGTVVTDALTGHQIADLSISGNRIVIAHGGVGGRGNAHFANSVHQAPKFAEHGEPGEHKKLKLELKLLADVGLLGFPNVGKSTLIAAVSAARPKIANYPFTTLVPNLGVVYVEQERSFVMADIPGIIEGASEGIGLGHQFLRHVSRSRLLIHLLDVSGMSGREPLNDFEVLNRELELYDERLAKLPQLIALNKIDAAADMEMIDALESELISRGHRVFRISAVTHAGVKPLIYECMTRLEALRAEEDAIEAKREHVHIVAPVVEDGRKWHAQAVDENTYEVVGRFIEKMVSMTDMGNEYALRRLQRTMDNIGITEKLVALGAKEGDTVRIGAVEFEYEDEEKWIEENESRRKQSKAKRGEQV